jgi:hypothetical protein
MTAAAAMVGTMASVALADQLPGGLGPCPGSDCPSGWPDPNNGPTAAGHCYAYDDNEDHRRPATGTVVNAGSETLFTGDGTSALQVFALDADVATAQGGRQGVTFAAVPDGAPVLVNVYGSARGINTYMGSLPRNGLREHLMWNIPDATDVRLEGTAQFQGSVLIGQRSRPATLSTSGANGLFYTAGSLTRTSSGQPGGQESHAYPFEGDLPACGEEPTPTPTPTPTDTPPPTPTPTPTDILTPTPAPTDTPTPTPTHSPGPKPTPTHTWPQRPDGPDEPGTWPNRPHSGGRLPHTGARGDEWILGGIAVTLVVAGSAAALMARRARRRG